MSKGNLFLGFGRGKVGDVVFTRVDGEQVARARNRHPRNPQTAVQLLSRVVMKTSTTAYSLLRPICDHSFQGRAEGTPNQSRFTVLNVAAMRARLAEYIYSGSPEDIYTCPEANFSPKDVSLPVVNHYVVSEGSLPTSDVRFSASAFGLFFTAGLPAGTTQATVTYQQLVDALGLSRGDQLTFVMLSVNDSTGPDADPGVYSGLRYARVILEPNDADMGSTFFTDGGAVNKPNTRNEGVVSLALVAATESVPAHLTFLTEGIAAAAGLANSAAAATVISSRLAGGTWQRSTQALVVRPSDITVEGHLQYDTAVYLMGESVASYMTVQNSSLYLNQSENF